MIVIVIIPHTYLHTDLPTYLPPCLPTYTYIPTYLPTYLPTTYLLHTYYIPTTYLLHTYYIPTTYLHNYIPTYILHTYIPTYISHDILLLLWLYIYHYIRVYPPYLPMICCLMPSTNHPRKALKFRSGWRPGGHDGGGCHRRGAWKCFLEQKKTGAKGDLGPPKWLHILVHPLIHGIIMDNPRNGDLQTRGSGPTYDSWGDPPRWNGFTERHVGQ